HAGDKPDETHHICSSTGYGDGSCFGVDGWAWKLPSRGRIRTVLESDDAKSRLALSGTLQLEDTNCTAHVVWAIAAADRTQISSGTLNSEGETGSLSEALP